MTYPTVVETDLKGFNLLRRGKVRDVYEIPPGRLLIVATDRISAFDSVLASPIPQKGIILNNISLFWFDKSSALVQNHIIERDVERFPADLKPYREILAGRSVIVRKTDVVPFECVVRGYLSGSGWREYKQSRTIGGVALPDGLVESDRLPEPFFSPATKADVGHDINVDEASMEKQIGHDLTQRLKHVSLSLYTLAAAYARERGIIIADTKFEFGLEGGELYIIDELLTPDSSRFWPLSEYVPGAPQKSYDKQYVRDYLESSGWDKNPPAPPLPESIATGTRAKYLAAYRQLVGRDLLPA